MAHKTKVSGTNYEVSGGKTKVNGTNYSIDKGKTLVGGTVYEVGFALPFTPILDFGAVTTNETPESEGYYELPSSIGFKGVPDGWNACTHLAINGEVYEVTCESPTTSILSAAKYTPVSDCIIVEVVSFYSSDHLATNIKFKEAGTYTVQLGVLE